MTGVQTCALPISVTFIKVESKMPITYDIIISFSSVHLALLIESTQEKIDSHELLKTEFSKEILSDVKS